MQWKRPKRIIFACYVPETRVEQLYPTHTGLAFLSPPHDLLLAYKDQLGKTKLEGQDLFSIIPEDRTQSWVQVTRCQILPELQRKLPNC